MNKSQKTNLKAMMKKNDGIFKKFKNSKMTPKMTP